MVHVASSRYGVTTPSSAAAVARIITIPLSTAFSCSQLGAVRRSGHETRDAAAKLRAVKEDKGEEAEEEEEEGGEELVVFDRSISRNGVNRSGAGIRRPFPSTGATATGPAVDSIVVRDGALPGRRGGAARRMARGNSVSSPIKYRQTVELSRRRGEEGRSRRSFSSASCTTDSPCDDGSGWPKKKISLPDLLLVPIMGSLKERPPAL